jgi:hypothetical protein
VTFTCVGTFGAGVGQFEYRDNYSSAQNIQYTAYSLIEAINKHPTCLVNAYYISSVDDPPGKILLEERAIGGSAFYATSSRGAAFNPELPPLGTSVASDNNTLPHGIFFSKLDQPEAVPLLNYFVVGSKSAKILRIKPRGDRLFVFKEDGIFVVTGEYPFSVNLLDNTAVLLAPDSVVTLNNKVYALTTQGVVEVSDSGVGIISSPIEADIKALFGETLSNLRTLTFAVGYESYRKLLLWLPSSSTDAYCTQAFVFDVSTNTWTRWTKAATCGLVHPTTDYLYLGCPNANKLLKERKDFTRNDYIDESSTLTIPSYTGKTLMLSDVTNVEVGDELYQTSSIHALVTAVDATASTATVDTTQVWTAGSVTLNKAIDCQVSWVPQFAGQPSMLKHWRECNFHFKSPGFTQGTGVFSTELAPAEISVTLNLGGWGQTTWGSFAWSQPSNPRNARLNLPLNCQRSSYLNIGFSLREARSAWSFYGYSLEMDVTSERNSR